MAGSKKRYAPPAWTRAIVNVIAAGVVLAVLWAACVTRPSHALRIVSLDVPHLVHNGTTKSVTLDCVYEHSAEDQKLVVKWFFNQDPKPIYQWIPDLNKRSYSRSAVFDGHINQQFQATHDKYTRYRALHITQPSVAMSGRYACSVTSLVGQDTRAQDMIVYAPPRRFDLSLLRPTAEAGDGSHRSEPRLRCHLEGVFPQPLLHMFTVQHTRIAGTEYVWVANLTRESYSVQPIGGHLDAEGAPAAAAAGGYLSILTTPLPSPRLAEQLSAQHHRLAVSRAAQSADGRYHDSVESPRQVIHHHQSAPSDSEESGEGVHDSLKDIHPLVELQGVPLQVILQNNGQSSNDAAWSQAGDSGGGGGNGGSSGSGGSSDTDAAAADATAVSRRQLFFCVFTIPSTDIRQSRVLEVYPDAFTSGSSAICTLSVTISGSVWFAYAVSVCLRLHRAILLQIS